MTALPFLSDLERLAKKATDGSGTTFDIDCSPFNILSLIAALRDVGIECAAAKQKLSSIRSAMLSEEAIETAATDLYEMGVDQFSKIQRKAIARAVVVTALDKAGIT